jgi:predicted ribosomally synthesized peptide with SipW-like signal peptide
MSKKRIKQYLMLLTVIGLVSIASGSGTFASFSAQTTNSGNTFAAGTLFLHNLANGTTTCTSESQTTGPNFNIDPAGCGVLFTADLSQGSTTAHLALSNAGSLDSTDLLAGVPTCAWSKNNGASPTFISLPADCSGVNVTIQETTTSSYAVDKYCAYGPSINAGVDCTTPDNTATLEALKTASQQLLTTAAASTTLTAAQTRYYVIKVDPSGVGTGNALQNLKLTFDMSWHIDQ